MICVSFLFSFVFVILHFINYHYFDILFLFLFPLIFLFFRRETCFYRSDLRSLSTSSPLVVLGIFKILISQQKFAIFFVAHPTRLKLRPSHITSLFERKNATWKLSKLETPTHLFLHKNFIIRTVKREDGVLVDSNIKKKHIITIKSNLIQEKRHISKQPFKKK